MNKALSRLAILISGVVITFAMAANEFAALDHFIETNKQRLGLPSGTAVAIVRDNKIVYQGYFGYADIANKIKVDENTAFYIASVTKPFFALTTLLKEKQGDISDETSLKELFPKIDFSYLDQEIVRRINIKHLLSHTAGIDNNPLVMATAYTGIHDNSIRKELISNSVPYEKINLNQFEYTNVGYNILSLWYEEFYQKDWQQTLEETIFKPLKMSHTSAYISEAAKQDWTIAKPYSLFNVDSQASLYLQKQDNIMHAAGGMISTVSDLGLFVIAQLNKGKVNGRQVFSEDVIVKSHQQLATVDSQFAEFKRSGYAWGWYIGEYKGQNMYHHFGAFSGDFSHVSFIPEKKIGIVILNNEDMLSGRLTSIISDYAYSILLGEEAVEERLIIKMDKLVGITKKTKQRIADKASKNNASKWHLSLDKSHYAGTYNHPLHGTVTVSFEQQQLVVSWGNLHSVATGLETLDSMRIELIPNRGKIAVFNVQQGKVMTIKVNDMLFTKT